jgi:hypothetical protein
MPEIGKTAAGGCPRAAAWAPGAARDHTFLRKVPGVNESGTREVVVGRRNATLLPVGYVCACMARSPTLGYRQRLARPQVCRRRLNRSHRRRGGLHMRHSTLPSSPPSWMPSSKETKPWTRTRTRNTGRWHLALRRHGWRRQRRPQQSRVCATPASTSFWRRGGRRSWTGHSDEQFSNPWTLTASWPCGEGASARARAAPAALSPSRSRARRASKVRVSRSP